jgi:hypothetical protein
MLMTQNKHVQKPSKNVDLERLMRVLSCSDDYVSEYPINDKETRRRIGKLISDAMQGHARQYTAGLK